MRTCLAGAGVYTCGPRRSRPVVGPSLAGYADTVEATRANRDSVANRGIGDVTDHYAKIIDGLLAQPILIGHSCGGLIAEKLLGMDRGEAPIAIDASQIKGVLQLLHHRGYR